MDRKMAKTQKIEKNANREEEPDFNKLKKLKKKLNFCIKYQM